MFSGIIEGTGEVKALHQRNGQVQLEVQAHFSLEAANIGDSIAVNGCCLTLTSRLGHTFWADLSAETLQVTALRSLQPGDTVNLEQALHYGGRVGGHLVQGHVDGVGRIVEIRERENCREFDIELPLPLTKYVIARGSIAIDGVSLTIARCQSNVITVCVIPHTGLKTTFARLQSGDIVNLEVDMVGKYIEKLAFMSAEHYHADTPIARAFRLKHGF